MKKPNYQPQLFVNRETECTLVANIAQQALDGARNRLRILAFYGERGSGKTWLALHLKRTVLAEIEGVVPLLLRFSWRDEDDEASHQPELGEWWEPQNQAVDDKIRVLMKWFAQQVGATTSRSASLETLAEWLVREVTRKYEGRLLVFILDSLFEADKEFLARLEAALLAPLVTLPNILIVMTGRGSLPTWASPKLRPQSDDLENLEPFDEENVKKLVTAQVPDFEGDFNEIYVLSGGHPFSAYLLAEESDRSKALDLAVETLLSVIPLPDRKAARTAFEALCVLESFREPEIQTMMATRYGDDNGELTIGEARKSRNLLLSTHLLRWQEGGVVIDGALAHLLRNYLQQDQPELFLRLHRRAFDMYSQLASGFVSEPETQKYYADLAEAHRIAMQNAGVDPANFPPPPAINTGSVAAVRELATI